MQIKSERRKVYCTKSLENCFLVFSDGEKKFNFFFILIFWDTLWKKILMVKNLYFCVLFGFTNSIDLENLTLWQCPQCWDIGMVTWWRLSVPDVEQGRVKKVILYNVILTYTVLADKIRSTIFWAVFWTPGLVPLILDVTYLVALVLRIQNWYYTTL